VCLYPRSDTPLHSRNLYKGAFLFLQPKGEHKRRSRTSRANAREVPLGRLAALRGFCAFGAESGFAPLLFLHTIKGIVFRQCLLLVICLLLEVESSFSGISCSNTQIFFDTNQLVVLRNTFASGRSTGLDLTNVESNCQVSNGGVFCFA
jgi:hypothetical protein